LPGDRGLALSVVANQSLNQDSEMPNFSTLIDAIEETRGREEAMLLRDDTCRSRFFLQPGSSRGVCLFFHGFTAIPQQFVTIGAAFFQAGYNVLIPLLPGHGQAGDWDGACPPPLPEDPQTYQQFGLYWLEQAQATGQKVIIGGLSGGSTLAAWLALERPEQIDRALIFAAYLSSSNKAVDLIVRILDFYFEWKPDPGVISFGYKGFRMPALRILLEMGQEVIDRAANSDAAPMLILSSESDRAVGREDHQALFEAAVQHQPRTWYYCFDKALDVPHNMMTKAEGNEHVNLVIAIAKAYVESDLTWAEVQAIAAGMAQGKGFNTVVAELNLSQRVSPDLPTILQLMAAQTTISSIRE
jgi:esterase/lipase